MFRIPTVLLVAIVCPAVVRAGITTDGVTGQVNVSSAANAVGTPAALPGANGGDDISPFTPPYQGLAILGDTTSSTPNSAAASLTLHFAQPVQNVPGADIGVFTNTGLVASFDPQSEIITAAAGPQLFSPVPLRAIVSVSADNSDWFTLGGGNPLDLANPSSQFSDSVLTYDTFWQYVSAAGGTAASDPYKPFNGTLADFAGKTSGEMMTLLGGSFGGAWIDLGPGAPAQVNYIRFDVPQGADYRLVLDAVTAVSAPASVPEPATAALLVLAAPAILRRRSRR